MVYPGEKEEEGSVPGKYMAMGPERSSKPLHNFTLPQLKWGNQRFLRCMKVDKDSSSSAGGGGSTDHRLRRSKFGGDSSSSGITAGSRESPEVKKDQRLRSAATDAGSGGRGGEEGIDEVREKIMLDLREVVDKMKKSILRGEEVSDDDQDDAEQEKEEEETVATVEEEKRMGKKEKKKEKVEPPPAAAAEEVRPWNLRTRRGAASSKAPLIGSGSGGVSNINNLNSSCGGGGGGYYNNHNRPLRIDERRGNYSPLRSESSVRERGAAMAVERPKFSVSLTKKEIEEDFIAMTGRRPPRRPKKRPRAVQKQMDVMFPGLWLSEITPDTYKVPETGENGKR